MALFMDDVHSGAGAEHFEDYLGSDGEHGTVEDEIEALQSLPPEERRRALRRLRNRESARRVRARRLAEMNQMEIQLKDVQDENAALKAHVGQLQAHVNAMTVKIYEVTAKYEAAVADNVRLKSEQPQTNMLNDSPFIASCSNAQHSGQLPFLGVSALASAQQQQAYNSGSTSAMDSVQALTAAHAQLRSKSPPDARNQRQAMEEVVALLQEHRRRNETAVLVDRHGSGNTSSVANPAQHGLNANSPLSDGQPAFSGAAGGRFGQSGKRSSLDVPVGPAGIATNNINQQPGGGTTMSAPLPTLPNPFNLAAMLHAQQQAAPHQQQQQQQHDANMSYSASALSAPYYSASSIPQNAGMWGGGLNGRPDRMAMPPGQMGHRSSSHAMDRAGGGGSMQPAAAAQQQQGLLGAHTSWPGIFGAVAAGANKDDMFVDFDDMVMPQDL